MQEAMQTFPGQTQLSQVDYTSYVPQKKGILLLFFTRNHILLLRFFHILFQMKKLLEIVMIVKIKLLFGGLTNGN